MNKAEKLAENLKVIVQRAPRAVGAIVSAHFRQNFDKQGFDDNFVRKWKARKKNGKKDKGRAILVKSGRLKRSIRVRRANQSEVVIGTAVPYARIHNEGGIIYRKAHGRKTGKIREYNGKKYKVKKHVRGADYKMPQRRYMGNSANLNKKIDAWYGRQIINAMKSIKNIT